MIHIAICDDEIQFIEALTPMLERYFEEIDRTLRISTFRDGADLLQSYNMHFDLIFLDIQMERVNGLETAKKIRKMDEEVSIIFLTSLAQYALEGYKYQAVNYILKPIKYVRLKSEMDKWIQKYSKTQPSFLLVVNDTGKYKVPLHTLYYIETFNRNLMLYTKDRNILCYRKMKELEEELEQNGFVRCHASYLVNMQWIKRVENLQITLLDGIRIQISQPKRKEVMEKLSAYWGNLM